MDFLISLIWRTQDTYGSLGLLVWFLVACIIMVLMSKGQPGNSSDPTCLHIAVFWPVGLALLIVFSPIIILMGIGSYCNRDQGPRSDDEIS